MNIAVIGCGVMAQSLVKGFYSHNKEQTFYCYTPSEEKAKALAQSVNGILVSKLSEFKDKKIDFWLLGMKPQSLSDFSLEFQKLKLKDESFISMLAAVKIEVLQKKLQSKNITRIMPNTPVKLSKGVSLVAHAEQVSQAQKNFTKLFLEKTSEVFDLSEKELELATVLSGSGPAYFFLFTKFLGEALSDMGIDQESALKLARLTLVGSAALVENDEALDLQLMIDQVTSKGGVTIEAVNSFKENKMDELSKKALLAAFERGEKLSSELL